METSLQSSPTAELIAIFDECLLRSGRIDRTTYWTVVSTLKTEDAAIIKDVPSYPSLYIIILKNEIAKTLENQRFFKSQIPL